MTKATDEDTGGQATQQQDGDESDGWQMIPDQVRVDARRAAIGGILATVVTLIGGWVVGEASGAEAHRLLETSLPATRSFCGTVTLALGNILALMLTLLSLSASSEVDLKWAHYQRIKQIAWVVSVSVIGAILVYLLLNVPLGQSDTASESTGFGYATLYYATLVISSLLAGAFITVVLMLYNTVRDIIRAVGPRRHDDLIRSEES